MREGKNLEATDKGIRLIEVVHPEVKSPAMTGQWEAYLKRIQRGEAQLEPFISGIEDYVREVVGKVGQLPAAARAAVARDNAPLTGLPLLTAVTSEPVTATENDPLDALLHRAFGFANFRANQEEV